MTNNAFFEFTALSYVRLIFWALVDGLFWSAYILRVYVGQWVSIKRRFTSNGRTLSSGFFCSVLPFGF
jgi:hypothetical protein